MAAVVEAAREMCRRDSKAEQEEYGLLLPCRKLSPLSPFIKLEEYMMLERDTGKYLLYMAALDRAVQDILNSQLNTRSLALKCLVLGPGLGRLIQYCLDVCEKHGANVVVHVLEANPLAVNFLKQQFKEQLDKSVHVYEPITFHPDLSIKDLPTPLQSHFKAFDIIVSELLGCFGDDEFLPELTAPLYTMFLKPTTGIPIPQDWTTYIAPVSIPSSYQYLQDKGGSLQAGYTMGLPPDCVFLADAQVAWMGDCRKVHPEYSADLEFELNRQELLSVDQPGTRIINSTKPHSEYSFTGENRLLKHKLNGRKSYIRSSDQQYLEDLVPDDNPKKSCLSNIKLQSHKECAQTVEVERKYKNKDIPTQECSVQDGRSLDNQDCTNTSATTLSDTTLHVHGFMGFFTSTLYKDIVIDTRLTRDNTTCFHWEAYLLPLANPVALDAATTRVRVSLTRKCERESGQNTKTDVKTTGLKLYYEWTCQHATCSEWNADCQIHNNNGESDAVFLFW